jgi:phosphatidylglycerol---prolipoprotein diacylglyceryl transferase
MNPKNIISRIEEIFQFSKTQFLSLYFALFFGVFSVVLFYPIREIFQGRAKLEQQLNIPFPQFLSILKPIFGTSLNIRFYALCILIGVLAGYALTLYIAKQYRIAGGVIDRLLLGITVFGLIGARAFYILFNFDSFVPEPLSVFFVWLGGLAFFGALIGSVGYLFLYCNRFKFNFFEFLDIITPGILLGQIFGRFGNFFNYESYGPATSVYWKMYIPQTAKISNNINQDFFHPTFLYEIIPNAILLVLILWFFKKITIRRSGLVFGSYCIGYGVIRFFTEFFRLDALKLYFPGQISILGNSISFIPASQLSAFILILIGLQIINKRRSILS